MYRHLATLDNLRETLLDDILEACPNLLGTILVRGNLRARIVEVEAYRAEGDAGSHAFRGKTPRNSAMFGAPGHAYVYFTYGNHWMLNIVAHQEGKAAAALVRAAEPLTGLDEMFERRPKAVSTADLLSGPGKLAAAFNITKQDYGLDLLDPASELHLEPGEPASCVLCGPRVGLASGKGDDLPWRFADADALSFVSSPRGTLR